MLPLLQASILAGDMSNGVRDADLEYTYFVLDQFCNVVGLHSILTARDGESALEDLHRALRGEAFMVSD